VVLFNWTDQGVQRARTVPDRAQAAADLAAKLGGRQVELYFTMGGVDVVGIYELPDDEAMARFALETASHGNTRTTVLKAFPRAEFVRIVESQGQG
jgi:uncharacterized protein with GYD domain